jgi:L-threonylcarbamoyladenylate synthase
VAPQNQPPGTRILKVDASGIAEAARLIRAGVPVAVPTETVYGLAADATDEAAVQRIYEAKGRPAFNPLIVHVADLAQAERLGTFSQAARKLAEAYWPGPLTIVVPHRSGSGVAEAVTAGLGTIALRSPAHPAMQSLLRAAGRPLAAPSANASGRISPTRAGHVEQSLAGRIALVLDGGPTRLGLESTIVRVGEKSLTLLRSGPVGIEALCETAELPAEEASGAIEAPGQLAGHYAPSKPLRLDAAAAEADEWLIGFGPLAGDETLSASGDLEEAAAALFDSLHRADASAKPRIAVAAIPGHGLGHAINDRLRRAAAPRSG